MTLESIIRLGQPEERLNRLHSDISSCLLPISPGQLTCKALYIRKSTGVGDLEMVVIRIYALCFRGRGPLNYNKPS